MKQVYSLVLLLLFLCVPLQMKAVHAYPFPIEFKQPNGEVIMIQMHGDEHFHYVTTLDGYLVSYDKSGYFTYAVISNTGQLVPGAVRVSNNILRGSTGLLKSDSKEFIEKVKQPAMDHMLETKLEQRNDNPLLRASTVSGNRKGLVILANFTDAKFTVSDAKNAFARMLNQSGYSENGATGSARDFYTENSGNQFIPEFDVYGPVELPNNMAYYGSNNASGGDQNAQQMIIDACTAANNLYPGLNFANYCYNQAGTVDFVFVFFAGYNEAENPTTKPNTIWPHKFSVASKNVTIDGVKLADYACTSELKGSIGIDMAGIGTFTHEFGHVLGLPDLYDVDKETNGEGPGVGRWCTMGSGNYLNEGRTPPFFGAMERYILGWLEPTTITATTTSVTKTLNPMSSSTNNQTFRVLTPTPGEYFLFEARKKQPGTWDAFLPGEGMLVYHIDKSLTVNKTVIINGKTYTLSAEDLWEVGIPNIMRYHQCMDMLRANNSVSDYSGNPYPGSGSVKLLSDYTNPGLLSWDKARTYVQISNITEMPTGAIHFDIVKNTVSPYPYIQTSGATNVLQTSATLNASLLENGPSAVTERGFCWGTVEDPAIEHSNTVKVTGTSLGAYSANITGLSTLTLYHVRAYVKTQDGNVYYGNNVPFTTLSGKKNLPFTETFDYGIPNFWTIKDRNNDGVSWGPATLKSGETNIGAAALRSNNNAANDWLITPQLAIPSGAGDIYFNFGAVFSSSQRLDLMVSESSMDESSFTTIQAINFEYSGVPGSGNLYGTFTVFTPPLLLNSYIGKSIFFGFAGKTENAGSEGALYLINISFTTQYNTGTEKVEANVPLVYIQDRFVYFKNVYEKYTAEFYDVTGKLHDRIAVPSDMSQYINEKGIYIVKLKNDKRTYTYKLIVR